MTGDKLNVEQRARAIWSAELRATAPKGEYAGRTFENSPSESDDRVVRAITAALQSQHLASTPPEIEGLREAVVTIIGRCEGLEDEASDELAKNQIEHRAGFYRGQKYTAKSLRNHLHDLTRNLLHPNKPTRREVGRD